MSIRDQGHYLTLAKGYSDLKLKNVSLGNYFVIWNQISYESVIVNGNENLYK